MPDAPYKTYSLLLRSVGVLARPADDTLSESSFLTMANAEELAENAIGSRLGSFVWSKTGTVPNALPGPVHSLSRLGGLSGASWRYAGSSSNLYRRQGTAPGAFTQIASTLSGSPWQAINFESTISSNPYLYIADVNGMLKDNGALSAPQQLGIFQPQYPVQAQAQAPNQIILDNYTSTVGYTYTGVSAGTLASYVSTTLTSAVTAVGLQSVTVASVGQPGMFQLLTIGSGSGAETVLVLDVSATGFTAKFTKTHASGSAVASQALSYTVPASTTAIVSKSFSGTPISAWPTTLDHEDYVGLYLYVNDPTQVQSITLKFDCGDGSFNTDYFYKVVGQGPLQNLLDNASDPTTATTDALLSESLGLYGNSASSIAILETGLGVWTPLVLQLSDFATSGRADFDDAVYNWSNVNGYQVEVVTNDSASATVQTAALVLFGGYGPDSFAGVAYDYMFTFYNNVDGAESNPSMAMSNINPPLQTNWVLPRRQPVQLTLTHPALDPQTTSVRIYRRGGTLGDNYRRVDEVPCSGSATTYTDVAADEDIQDADIISFVNDVPVTSSLPVPVNTTLAAAITTANQVVSVYPESMTSISVAQQVSLGSSTSTGLTANFETVVVLTVASDHFTAFVQNTHAQGETVSATAKYGQPVTIIAEAFDQVFYAGDPNNPSYLYNSAKSNGQAVSSAAYQPVSTPDDPITAIVKFKGNLYVATRTAWWSAAPGSNGIVTVYPTACKKGCVAPLGYVVTEDAIIYQAIDGIRAFAGGGSQYLTLNQEFVFQGVGSTPVPAADPAQFAQTRAALWNQMVFFSYVATDGNRHRLILHTDYKRWRNDDVAATAMYTEEQTNTLLLGDENGLVRIDRVGAYDEGIVGGAVAPVAIPMNVQLPYLNMGQPAVQKNYNELTIDANTGGQPLTVTLLFDDGATSLAVGTVNTATRQRVNLNINQGDGYQAYKVSLRMTCNATTPVYVYQAAIRTVTLARTRKSFDTYWLRQGTDSSKLLKDTYLEYESSMPIVCEVYYDQSPTPLYTFTLPIAIARTSQRVRFPAIKYRLVRLVMTSAADFMLWDESFMAVKPVLQGSKGYQQAPLGPDE